MSDTDAHVQPIAPVSAGTGTIQLDPPAVAPHGGAVAPLQLAEPQAVAAVQPAQAEGAVPLDQAELAPLDEMAATFIDGMLAADVHSAEFEGKVAAVRDLGSSDIKAAANVSNTLLEKPMQAIKRGGFDAGEKVSSGLLDLRETMEDLDPSHDRSGLLGILDHLPFVDKVQGYFRRYEKAQTHIDGILKSLYGGKDELLRDNAAVEQERANLWATMHRLQQYAYVAAKLDSLVSAKVETLRASDPARATAMENDVLFAVRQKHQDLLTQLAVSVQGYLALGLIKQNNIELVKGVDRATTTTISALRTAVIVAQALADQKLVLDQIDALNTTTSSLIASTSEMLRTQTERTYQQAASSGVDMKALETAFQNVFATMDAIDTFKSSALQSMKTTVDGLQVQIDKSRDYIERSSGTDNASPASGAGAATGELRIP